SARCAEWLFVAKRGSKSFPRFATSKSKEKYERRLRAAARRRSEKPGKNGRRTSTAPISTSCSRFRGKVVLIGQLLDNVNCYDDYIN
ncbi:MAG: hypothetical protein ABI624_05840, partial [Casimicrobiaceae bacterium]